MRYCGMCDAKVARKECPKCGADTDPLPRLVSCPFCEEADFDKKGLRLHFMNGWCPEFKAAPVAAPPSPPDLRAWVQHLPDCDTQAGTWMVMRPHGTSCTCGLDDTLAGPDPTGRSRQEHEDDTRVDGSAPLAEPRATASTD